LMCVSDKHCCLVLWVVNGKKNSLIDACPLTKPAAEFSMSRFTNFHKKTWKTRQLSGTIMLKITTPSLTLKTTMIIDNGPKTLLNTTKTRLDVCQRQTLLPSFMGC
jgi:hypothetical protein